MSRKIYVLLKEMSKPELNRLEKLVNSPYFNTSELVIRLYDQLLMAWPEFDELDEASLYRTICNATDYSDQEFRLLLSYLHKLCEQFLIQEQLSAKPIVRDQLLLSALEAMDLDKQFHLKISGMRKAFEREQRQDIDLYYNKMLLEEADYSYQSTRKSRTVDNNLERLVDAVDAHFLYKRLKYSCELINLQNILAVEYDLSFADKLIEWLRENPIKGVPAISIYLQILLTLREPTNKEHYSVLRKLLVKNLQTVEPGELRDMYAFVQNYCIRQANLGASEYLAELFDIYQLLLENKIITSGNRISQFDFKNIVTVALRQNAFEWTEQFLAMYSPMLERPYRENAYHYNMARLQFAQQHYRAALRSLLKVQYTDVFYELDSRSLLLKTYFELEEYESFLSLASAFSMFLRRNKEVSEYQTLLYKNQIRFARKLMKIKMGGKRSIESLKAEMEEEKKIADLTWLRSKAEELES